MSRATDKPIDRGWAWVQVLGAAICNFFVVGAFKSLGILFVEFRTKFNASYALTALMMGITSGGMSLLAPATNNLADRYTSRKCVMLGGCLLGIATFLAAFAPNIYYVIAVFGVFTGISYSFLYGPSLMMVGYYFEKRRSTANGLAVAGSSVGQLVIPQLIMYLLKEYTLQDTLIIYSAVALHTVAAGALLTPMSFYDRDERRKKREKRLEKKKKQTTVEVCLEEGSGETEKEQLNGKAVGEKVEASSDGLELDKQTGNGDLDKQTGNGGLDTRRGSGDLDKQKGDLDKQKSDLDKQKGDLGGAGLHTGSGDVNAAAGNGEPDVYKDDQERSLLEKTAGRVSEKQVAEKHTGMLLKKIDDHYTSQSSLYLAPHQTVPDECVKLEQELHPEAHHVGADASDRQKGNCLTRCFRGLWDLYEWSLFKRSLFVIYVITICLGNCGYVNIFLFLPPHAHDLGITEDKAAMLLSIAGISDLFGRIFGGFFADLGLIKRSTFMAITIIFTGVSAIISTFFDNYISMVVLCVVMGLVGGFYISMMAVVLVDFVGLEKFPSALGLTIMCMGFTNCGTPTMLGMIRDQTGSYGASFWVCGCMMIVAGISILFEPLARRLDHRNNPSLQQQQQQ